jgi:hypothetical protein
MDEAESVIHGLSFNPTRGATASHPTGFFEYDGLSSRFVECPGATQAGNSRSHNEYVNVHVSSSPAVIAYLESNNEAGFSMGKEE